MASDKRVLLIGLLVMALLVGIGAVSASLFASSACGDIDPGSGGQVVAGDDLAAVLDGETGAAVEGLAGQLQDELGPLAGVAEVPGASALTWLGGGVAATGETTAVLDAAGSDLRASAGFDEVALHVGDGSRIYSLALINELTGQVDALLPLDADLEPGTCQDTAVVGDPFAFHLDAGGGELLLFRVEEDSDDPELELRDAVTGRRWLSVLDVPVAPPGVLAERVTARWHQDTIVAARRLIPGEEEPAVFAVARDDGEALWDLAADDVVEVMGEDEPIWLDVRHLDSGVAIVAASHEERRDHVVLLTLDLATGELLEVAEPGGDTAVVHDVEVVDDRLVIAWQQEGEVVLSVHGDGEDAEIGRWSGDRAIVGEGVAVLGSVVVPNLGGMLEEAAPEGAIEVPAGLTIVDVLEHEGGVSLLIQPAGGEPGVVTTFAAPE